jgi:hypothetical protein
MFMVCLAEFWTEKPVFADTGEVFGGGMGTLMQIK